MVPSRLKEYAFLVSVVAIAIAYGMVHEFITSSISPEYFVFGKGIITANEGFNGDVARLAAYATWWVGLIIAVAFLAANNLSKSLPQLSILKLYALLVWPFACAILLAIMLGAIFYFHPPASTADWSLVLPRGTSRRCVAVWGIHNGSYYGGLAGTIIAIIHIRRLRKKLGSFSQDIKS